MAKAEKKGTSKEIAEVKDASLAEYAGFEEFAGAGFENQTADDYAIPFLHILQALSPQIQDNDDLKAGMVINTVTGETFNGKSGLAFVPATTQRQYVEWRPRESGGGFVAAHDLASDVVKKCLETQEFGAYTTPDGNELIETFYVYGIAIDDDGNAMEAVLAFTSSKIKKYKGWMTKAKTIQIPLPDGRRIPAPLFSHRYRLKSVSEKNNKGSYFNWDIAFDGSNATEARLLPSDPIFQRAVGIKDLLDSGKARAAYESQGGTSDEGSPESAPF